MIEVLNYAGIVVGIISVATTIIVAMRYARISDPRFDSLTELKVGAGDDLPDEVAVYFEDNRVPRVSSTLLWFWNSGNRAIRRQDLVPEKPLTMTLVDAEGEAEILDVSLRKATSGINFKAAKVDASAISIDFEYLGHNEGAVVEILHTASSGVRVKPSGVILDTAKGIRPTSKRGRFADVLTRERVIRGLRSQLVATALLTVFSLAMLFGAYRAMTEINTNEQILHELLRPHMSTTENLEAAVQAIVEARLGKYELPMAAVAFPLIFALLFFCLYSVWKAGYSCPASLVLEPGSRKDAQSREKG